MNQVPIESNLSIEEKYKRLQIEKMLYEDTKKQLKKLVLNLEEKEKSLKEATLDLNKFKQAVDASTDAIIITLPSQDIVYVNKACENIMGISFEEALGKNVNEFLVSDNVNIKMFEELQKTIKSGNVYNTEEMYLKNKAEHSIQVQLSIFPIKADTSIDFFVGIFRDIRERKSAERMKTEFVSLASHQLQTPLTAINWYIESLMDPRHGTLTDKQKEDLHEVYKGSKRMVSLVNDLLNVSRLETGRLTIEPKEVELVSFINNIIEECMPLCKRNSTNIVFEKPGDKKINISVDITLFRQVMHNLLTNAIRYSNDGGEVIVSIKEKDGGYVICVKDLGIGIPKDVQSNIYTKFFRANNARSKTGEGSGLGLYLVKMIIESSGGKIWFESVEGKGTTFCIWIPVNGMIQIEGEKGLAM